MLRKHCITWGNSGLALELSLKMSPVLGTQDAGKSEVYNPKSRDLLQKDTATSVKVKL